MQDFSGYVAADELYDGPSCILSLVDIHTIKRLDYQVPDHAAQRRDLVAFFERFQARLKPRDLQVLAITTDGSSLYPGAIQAVFGAVPHQIYQFHVLMDITKAVLHAVAYVRKTLATKKLNRRRGRPANMSGPPCAGRSASRPRSPTCSPIAICLCSAT